MLPLVVMGQVSKTSHAQQRYTSEELLKSLERLHATYKRYKNSMDGGKLFSTDTVDVKPIVQKLTNFEIVSSIWSDSITNKEKLEYVIATHEGVGKVLSYYYELKEDKSPDVALLWGTYFKLLGEECDLIDIILKEGQPDLVVFSNMYVHPLFQQIFQTLSPINKPENTMLGTSGVDICQLSNKYLKFYKKNKKLIDESFTSSYDWKVKNIGAKHWSTCVQQSALKNL